MKDFITFAMTAVILTFFSTASYAENDSSSSYRLEREMVNQFIDKYMDDEIVYKEIISDVKDMLSQPDTFKLEKSRTKIISWSWADSYTSKDQVLVVSLQLYGTSLDRYNRLQELDITVDYGVVSGRQWYMGLTNYLISR